MDAYYAAKQFVTKSLKAPSTAKFPNPYSGSDCGAFGSNDVYAAWGYVDSQNSFGAMIRSEWKAAVKDKGESWQLLYLRVGDGESVGDPQVYNSVIGRD